MSLSCFLYLVVLHVLHTDVPKSFSPIYRYQFYQNPFNLCNVSVRHAALHRYPAQSALRTPHPQFRIPVCRTPSSAASLVQVAAPPWLKQRLLICPTLLQHLTGKSSPTLPCLLLLLQLRQLIYCLSHHLHSPYKPRPIVLLNHIILFSISN